MNEKHEALAILDAKIAEAQRAASRAGEADIEAQLADLHVIAIERKRRAARGTPV